MSATIQGMTAEELLRMPDDGFRYELIRGELKKMVPAGSNHGRIAVNVAVHLAQHVKANQLGIVYAAETGFVLALDPDTVRAPDVAFVRQERIEEVGEVEGYWPGAPDLAVEVISPGDLYTEVEEKVFTWLEAGTCLVVVVDPRRRTVAVYRGKESIRILTAGEMLRGGEVVSGWEVAVEELFQ